MYNAIPYASSLGDDIEFPDIKIATHETFTKLMGLYDEKA